MTDRLTKARTAMILDAPFFGTIALRHTFIAQKGFGTMATTGTKLIYDPAWVETLTDQQLAAVLTHEMMHIALGHHLRRGSRNLAKWNIACDHAVNLILTEMPNIVLLEDALCDPQYHNMPAEAIYNRIEDNDPENNSNNQPGNGNNSNNQPGNNQDPGNMGAVLDAENPDGTPLTEAQLATREAENTILVQQAAQAAKAHGKLPAHLARLVNEIVSPKIDWKTALRRFIDQHARDDYSWSRPNRRHIATGLYLPSVKSDEIPPIVVALDTSGSIHQTELNAMAAELAAILGECPISTLQVLYCDTEVTEGPVYTKQDTITLKTNGGGGTLFQPVFTWIEKSGLLPAALIYITDGHAEDAAPAEPPYPVLWVITPGGKEVASWGETIRM